MSAVKMLISQLSTGVSTPLSRQLVIQAEEECSHFRSTWASLSQGAGFPRSREPDAVKNVIVRNAHFWALPGEREHGKIAASPESQVVLTWGSCLENVTSTHEYALQKLEYPITWVFWAFVFILTQILLALTAHSSVAWVNCLCHLAFGLIVLWRLSSISPLAISACKVLQRYYLRLTTVPLWRNKALDRPIAQVHFLPRPFLRRRPKVGHGFRSHRPSAWFLIGMLLLIAVGLHFSGLLFIELLVSLTALAGLTYTYELASSATLRDPEISNLQNALDTMPTAEDYWRYFGPALDYSIRGNLEYLLAICANHLVNPADLSVSLLCQIYEELDDGKTS